ncbi:putative RER1 protein [Daphnia magna]|uniref:Putative RER1 protein n=1 Tax=Daphnia magna TaxID=35525 RepID=A0A164M4C0_9CRUS|nr:putative RER1 protein [Daphnia magna]
MQFFKRLGQAYQSLLDKSTPHPISRWIFTFVLITMFLARVFFSKARVVYSHICTRHLPFEPFHCISIA